MLLLLSLAHGGRNIDTSYSAQVPTYARHGCRVSGEGEIGLLDDLDGCTDVMHQHWACDGYGVSIGVESDQEDCSLSEGVKDVLRDISRA